MERSVYYDQLSAQSVEELKEFAEEQGMLMLQTLNRRARELQQRDANSDNPQHRMNLGVYYYDTEEN